MSADLSRVRFDPLRDHSGIGSMQGRVWLDADFNEQVAITDRRLRAQVVDLAPAPSMVSRLTPDAFKITEAGGVVSIGAGRMYVDGLLVENHGAALALEPILAEPNGSGTLKYEEQPYRRGVTDMPKTGGQHLFYLVAWQRELDHLNTPDLVEPAIGVETTTRTQAVWQVGVLPSVGANLACDSATPKWTELITPSSAQLTTGTDDTAPPSGPCEVPPSKGYRGPENQLYRVELHSETEFKWSRDNATITSAVDKTISTSRLRLATLGRDELLSIKSGDWLEILDDKRELDRAPGEMRKVTVEEGNVIFVDPALPADLANSTLHLRVRKWDSGPTKILGGGKAQLLEHGVTVAFTFAAKGKPHPGDHWVFAARVADASVEKLTAAPPRGIHPHYAKLALVTIGGPITDCRPDWPSGGEGCECEICVAPGDSLQDAIETLKKRGGGTLMLCPGTYNLDEPLLLDGAKSVRIRGAGEASRIVAGKAGIVVTRSQDIVLENFAIGGDGDLPPIAFGAANQTCVVDRLKLSHEGGAAITLTGAQYFLTIRDCLFDAKVGVAAGGIDQESKGLLTFGLSIRDNLLGCADRGIDLGIDRHGVVQHTGLTAVTGNHITVCADAGIVMTGLVPQDVADLDGALDISGNLLEITGSGIVTGGRARLSDNTVLSAHRVETEHGITLQAAPPDTPNGVAQMLGNKITGFGGYGVVVSAPMASLLVKQNVVRECGGGMLIQPAAPGGRVAVDNNQILDLHTVKETTPLTMQPVGSVFLADRGSRVSTVAAAPAEVEPTLVLTRGTAAAAARASRTTGVPAAAASPAAAADTEVTQPRLSAAYAVAVPNVTAAFTRASIMLGISVVGAETVLVAGNTVDGLAADPDDGNRYAYGILVGTCVDARVTGNLVARIGTAETGGSSIGIGCFAWQNTMSVTQNTVRGEAVAQTRPAWTPLLLLGSTLKGLQFARSAPSAAGTWTFVGDNAYLAAQTVANAELTGNTLQGGTEDPTLLVMTAGDVALTGNRGAQPATAGREVARVTAATVVAQGNRFKGGDPSLLISAQGGAVAIGNITSGGIQVNGTALPPDTLNPIG
jgi:Family of unknown function (DUF6519)